MLFREPDANSDFRVFFGPHGAARGYLQPRGRKVRGDLEPELCYEYPGFCGEPWLMDAMGAPKATISGDCDLPRVYIKFSCNPKRTDKVRAGPHIRSSHFCQPPVKTLQIRINCCVDLGASACASLPKHLRVERVGPNGGTMGYPFVYCPTGWIIGDLLDVTAIVCRAHKLCLYAQVSSMEIDGYVECEVCFTKGKVIIGLEDPLVLPYRSTPKSPGEGVDPQHPRLLEAYRAFKVHCKTRLPWARSYEY